MNPADPDCEEVVGRFRDVRDFRVRKGRVRRTGRCRIADPRGRCKDKKCPGWVLGVLALVVVVTGVGWFAPNYGTGGTVSPPGDSGTVADRTGGGGNSDVAAGELGIIADFEPCGGIILGGSQLLEFHERALVDIVLAVHGQAQIYIVVSSTPDRKRAEELLLAAGLCADAVTYLDVPSSSMWIRDYGPTFVRHPENRIYAIDAVYDRPGQFGDEEFPRYVAGYFRLPVMDSPLILPGGNLLSNGRGLCVTTSDMLTKNEPRGFDRDDITAILGGPYQMVGWAILDPLVGEPTRHLDMFVALPEPYLAVVGSYEVNDDPVNAALLDWNVRILKENPSNFKPMRVERIPMPPRTDGVWRSYTNVITVNQTLLVPVYPSAFPDLDEQALAIYRRLLPGWSVVPIDAESLARNGGALHCVSCNVPVL